MDLSMCAAAKGRRVGGMEVWVEVGVYSVQIMVKGSSGLEVRQRPSDETVFITLLVHIVASEVASLASSSI